MWIFTPGLGHRHAQSRKQLPLTETWKVFFFLFTLVWGLSHQLTTTELNHTVIGPEESLIFFCFMHFQKTPLKGSVPGAVVRNARDKQEYYKGVISTTKPGCLMFSLVHLKDDTWIEEWSDGAQPQTSSSRSETQYWSVAHTTENCKKCNHL